MDIIDTLGASQCVLAVDRSDKQTARSVVAEVTGSCARKYNVSIQQINIRGYRCEPRWADYSIRPLDTVYFVVKRNPEYAVSVKAKVSLLI